MFGKGTENLLQLQARNDLNTIVRNLELYKLRHQHYPDSLKELEKQDPTLFIVDPLQGRNPAAHKYIYFYYDRKGDNYELFSAGKDGIPHTEDDIYPEKPLK